MPISKGKCPSCKGTGVAARLGPAGVLFVKETPARENGTQTKVQDAMTFVEPTATTLTFLREEINANTTAGRKMLHLYSETPVAGGDAETATQVGVGVKAQTAFIAPIASQIFGLMDFTLSCIARQRYGDDEGMFTLVPATQYELRTEADYIALLGEATQKGLPPAAIEEILRGYFNIRYASNPDMQRAFEVIAIADTLLTTNWQQITAMRAKNEVTAWEVALHQQALSLYDKLMQDPQFRGLETVFDKAEAMREFARVNLGGEQQPAQAPALTPAQRARELAQETEVEDDEDDTDMIEGVIELLRGITDMENRQRSAEQRLADFAREGVTVDRADFLQRVMA